MLTCISKHFDQFSLHNIQACFWLLRSGLYELGADPETGRTFCDAKVSLKAKICLPQWVRFPKMRDPHYGLFRMENPINIGWFRGTPNFGSHQMASVCRFGLKIGDSHHPLEFGLSGLSRQIMFFLEYNTTHRSDMMELDLLSFLSGRLGDGETISPKPARYACCVQPTNTSSYQNK